MDVVCVVQELSSGIGLSCVCYCVYVPPVSVKVAVEYCCCDFQE
jgi:hypothetical protein